MRVLLLLLLLCPTCYAGNFNDNGVNMEDNTDANLFRLKVSSPISCHVYSVHVGSLTNFPAPDYYEIVRGTVSDTSSEYGWFEQQAGSCVKYLYAETRDFEIEGYINGVTSNPNDLYGAAIYVNDVKQGVSYAQQYFAGPTHYDSLYFKCDAVLQPNDIVCIKIANENATNAFVLFKWHLIIHEHN